MQPISILIVDDNTAAKKLLRSVLINLGLRFIIHEASSGAEALRMIREGYYHIIFLDIEMPEMSGFDILKKVIKDIPNQFVNIVSANATIMNVKKTKEFGGKGFVAKPYKTEKIKAVIDTYLTSKA